MHFVKGQKTLRCCAIQGILILVLRVRYVILCSVCVAAMIRLRLLVH